MQVRCRECCQGWSSGFKSYREGFGVCVCVIGESGCLGCVLRPGKEVMYKNRKLRVRTQRST